MITLDSKVPLGPLETNGTATGLVKTRKPGEQEDGRNHRRRLRLGRRQRSVNARAARLSGGLLLLPG